jgi:hypothetical protein
MTHHLNWRWLIIAAAAATAAAIRIGHFGTMNKKLLMMTVMMLSQ